MEILGLVDIPTWLLILVGLLLSLYIYLTWTFGAFKSIGVNGPKPVPLFGTMWPGWSKGFMTYDINVMKEYGKTVGLFDNRTPVLLTSDENLIRAVNVKEFDNFINRRLFAIGGEPVSSMLSFLEDDAWRRVRSLMSPAFSSGKLKQMNAHVNACARQLAQNLEEHALNSTPVDIKEYCGSYAMDVIASTSFGLQLDSQKDPDSPFVKMAKKCFNFSFFNPIFLTAYFLPFTAPIFQLFNVKLFPKDVTQFFTEITEQTIKQRQQSGEKRMDILQLMMDAHEGPEVGTESKEEGTDRATYKPRKAMTHDELVAQCILFFVAGYDTTSSAVRWLCYNLTLYPEVQEKLYQEIKRHVRDEDFVDYDELNQMPYLEMCILESLRMYTPTFRNERVVKKDINLGGIHLKKDWIVAFPAYAMHRDPDVWSDPEVYRPERFSPEERTAQTNYQFMPFGLGPRNCIGMRLALMEVKIAIIHIIKAYKLVTCSETQIPIEWKVPAFLSPKKPVKLGLQQRAR